MLLLCAPVQEQLQAFCNDPGWQASTLKLLQEQPFAALFKDLGKQTSFDPTGLEHVNNYYYVVFNRCCRPVLLITVGHSTRACSDVLLMLGLVNWCLLNYCTPQ